MTSKSIISQLKTYLQDDTTLSTYVRSVYLGVRTNIPDSDFPCIIIEPVSNLEDESQDLNTLQRCYFSAIVLGYVNVIDVDRQVVGDTVTKGIMDLENDIKIALSAFYPNLNSTCISFKFKNSTYDYEKFPIRGVSIEMEFYYQQNRLTRA